MRPLDVVVSVQIALAQGAPGTIATLADSLGMDHAQVHRALKNSVASGLIQGTRVGHRVAYRANHAALVEFLLHGVRYVFPPVRGGNTRGLATGYAAGVMAAHIAPGDAPPPVWPHPDGSTRGETLVPLHRCVPDAARRDPALYAAMALVDVLRAGRARERTIATRLLPGVLRGAA